MVLQNGDLVVYINRIGAELTSLKYKGREFLWNADERYWNRHAPVLFPIVGRLKNNTMVVDDKEYSMGQHGFARDCEFKEVEVTEKSMTYLLTDDKNTREMYPYNFEFYITYELYENKVKVTYKVKNTDNKNIFFSVGGHPAFRWPLKEGEKFEDYYIEFEKNETQKFIKNDGGILSYEDSYIIKDENRIDLDKSKFSIDTFVFEKLKSDRVSFKSKKSNCSVNIYAKNFPYFGIWSREDEANFICLEPWYGIADFSSCGKKIEEKPGILELNIGEIFECSYIIEVND